MFAIKELSQGSLSLPWLFARRQFPKSSTICSLLREDPGPSLSCNKEAKICLRYLEFVKRVSPGREWCRERACKPWSSSSPLGWTLACICKGRNVKMSSKELTGNYRLNNSQSSPKNTKCCISTGISTENLEHRIGPTKCHSLVEITKLALE